MAPVLLGLLGFDSYSSMCNNSLFYRIVCFFFFFLQKFVWFKCNLHTFSCSVLTRLFYTVVLTHENLMGGLKHAGGGGFTDMILKDVIILQD